MPAQSDYFDLVMKTDNNHNIIPGTTVMQHRMWWKIAAKSHLLQYFVAGTCQGGTGEW